MIAPFLARGRTRPHPAGQPAKRRRHVLLAVAKAPTVWRLPKEVTNSFTIAAKSFTIYPPPEAVYTFVLSQFLINTRSTVG